MASDSSFCCSGPHASVAGCHCRCCCCSVRFGAALTFFVCSSFPCNGASACSALPKSSKSHSPISCHLFMLSGLFPATLLVHALSAAQNLLLLLFLMGIRVPPHQHRLLFFLFVMPLTHLQRRCILLLLLLWSFLTSCFSSPCSSCSSFLPCSIFPLSHEMSRLTMFSIRHDVMPCVFKKHSSRC